MRSLFKSFYLSCVERNKENNCWMKIFDIEFNITLINSMCVFFIPQIDAHAKHKIKNLGFHYILNLIINAIVTIDLFSKFLHFLLQFHRRNSINHIQITKPSRRCQRNFVVQDGGRGCNYGSFHKLQPPRIITLRRM